jgi:zinc protease
MRRFITATLLAFTLTACATASGQSHLAQGHADPIYMGTPTAPPSPAAQPAPLSQLVQAVDIPYETFTLPNGLTTIVHTDRKAPIVGVTVYYRVGSKSEPRGRTGFAHLFEHLMFNGSENVENFDVPLEAAGSTSTNGSTAWDRTNYVETVPTGALDLALFMESDRMGHLLGAVDQATLDQERGIVQNEKRQGDNDPYGLVEYAMGDGLFPVGHPYRHSVIGSMADLDAARIADVRQWFVDNYAPNNVVLALAGDIDAATARPMVERWFGAIPRGPDVHRTEAGPITLAAPVRREMVDQVPVTRLQRMWSGPGLNDPDAQALDIGLRILGGLSSSRLDNALVRGEGLAVSVSAQDWQLEQTSLLFATMDIKPGTDRAVAEARFDALIAQYIAEGPNADEVRRAATSAVTEQIGALEGVGGFSGKGAQLAEGQLYSGDPAKFRRDLDVIAALTPAQVQAAMQRWLSRPVFALAVVPGERTERGETMGGWGDEATTPPPAPDAKLAPPPLATGPHRAAPAIAAVGDLAFPAVERATLSNGIPVVLARRTTVPKVLVSLNFDAGTSADFLDTPGTQSLMLGLLDEGTANRNATQIAEEQERLGASISAGAGVDSSAVTLSALTANLAPSLALMRDVVRNPAFRAEDFARVRSQQQTALAQSMANPRGLASRAIAPVLFGSAHPYGLPSDGLGNADSLAALTPDALRAAHDRWLRPDLARITVVGDVTMAQLQPLLEAAFGNWQAPASPRPEKPISAAVPAPSPRIVLIDRPNSPQSVILAGRVLALTGRDQGLEALELANEVLGNGFLSRLNQDLRVEKTWSYGVRSNVQSPLGPRAFMLSAPVQADRTGDSIREIMQQMTAFPGSRPVDPVELNRVTDGNIRGLPNRYETNGQLLGAIITNDRLGRAENYYATLPTRYRAVDAAAIDGAARQYLQPQGLVFVVVGDRRLVEPQLQGLGLPVVIAPVDTTAPQGE